MIILRLFLGLLANGVADIDKLLLDKAVVEKLSQKKRAKYMSLLVDRQEKLASAFREHMTEGQTYHSPNPYRSRFYTDVTNEAEAVTFLSFLIFVRMTVLSSLLEYVNKLTTKTNLSMAVTFGEAKACKGQAKVSVAS